MSDTKKNNKLDQFTSDFNRIWVKSSTRRDFREYLQDPKTDMLEVMAKPTLRGEILSNLNRRDSACYLSALDNWFDRLAKTTPSDSDTQKALKAVKSSKQFRSHYLLHNLSNETLNTTDNPFLNAVTNHPQLASMMVRVLPKVIPPSKRYERVSLRERFASLFNRAVIEKELSARGQQLQRFAESLPQSIRDNIQNQKWPRLRRFLHRLPLPFLSRLLTWLGFEKPFDAFLVSSQASASSAVSYAASTGGNAGEGTSSGADSTTATEFGAATPAANREEVRTAYAAVLESLEQQQQQSTLDVSTELRTPVAPSSSVTPLPTEAQTSSVSDQHVTHSQEAARTPAPEPLVTVVPSPEEVIVLDDSYLSDNESSSGIYPARENRIRPEPLSPQQRRRSNFDARGSLNTEGMLNSPSAPLSTNTPNIDLVKTRVYGQDDVLPIPAIDVVEMFNSGYKPTTVAKNATPVKLSAEASQPATPDLQLEPGSSPSSVTSTPDLGLQPGSTPSSVTSTPDLGLEPGSSPSSMTSTPDLGLEVAQPQPGTPVVDLQPNSTLPTGESTPDLFAFSSAENSPASTPDLGLESSPQIKKPSQKEINNILVTPHPSKVTRSNQRQGEEPRAKRSLSFDAKDKSPIRSAANPDGNKLSQADIAKTLAFMKAKSPLRTFNPASADNQLSSRLSQRTALRGGRDVSASPVAAASPSVM